MEKCSMDPIKGLRCFKFGGRDKSSSRESLLTRMKDKAAINREGRKMEKEERLKTRSTSNASPIERDFTGDVNPGGFGEGKGKKGSRFINVQGKGYQYVKSILDKKKK